MSSRGFSTTKEKKAAFDRFCTVAPPQMLGELREEMSEDVKRLIDVEISKDLSMPPPRAQERLEEVLRP